MFTSSELINHFGVGHSFSSDDGFRIAFAILDKVEPGEFQTDDLVKMEVKQFVLRFDGATGVAVTEDVTIPSFPCS